MVSKSAIALISSSVVVVITLIVLAALGFFTTAVDCEVSAWGPCDPLTGKRKRTITKQKQGRGKDCPVLEEDCPVNCVMSAWGACTNDKQTRTVTTPAKNGGTACGTLEQACVVPFTAGSTLATDPQQFSTIHYLDRFPRLCPTGAINGFKVVSVEGTGQAKIDYKCASGLDSGTKVVDKLSEPVNGNMTVNLVPAEVKCEAGEVLSNYGMAPGSGYRFKYDCIKSTKNLTCTEKETSKSTRIEDLDVSCPGDQVISSIKAKDHGDNIVSYIYNCCKKALPA